jgi:hypothetical protein
MKSLFGNSLILAALPYLFGFSACLSAFTAVNAEAYSQTLIPSIMIFRPDVSPDVTPAPDFRPSQVTVRFTETPAPTSKGKLTVTATGDINEPDEYVRVEGEGGVFLGQLFRGQSGRTETQSLTIPIEALTTFAANGVVAITFKLEFMAEAAEVRIDAATLIYEAQ